LLCNPGKMPTEQFIQSYGLQDYLPLIESLRSGSLALFLKYMNQNIELLLQRGTYFLVERLKMFVYRKLFRRVTLSYAQSLPDGGDPAHIPLQLFQAALAWQGEKLDPNEVECIFANLIYRGLIKGYLSHAHQMLVLVRDSTDKQFPFWRQAKSD